MANIILRTLLLFFSLLVMLRLMGKRQIAQLQPYEFALMLISSNLVTVPMSDLDTPLLWGIIPIYVLLAAGMLLSFLSLKSLFLRGVICGKPRLLIKRGVIDNKALKDVRYTLNDLLEQLRSNDVFDISEVYYAYLETNGEISVILKKDQRNVKVKDLNLKVKQDDINVSLIMDKQIIKENLHFINKDTEWLKRKVSDAGFTVKDVLLLTYDGTRLYIHGKNRIKEVYL